MPQWQEYLTWEFEHTIFSSDANVSIGLRMDERMLGEYDQALIDILHQPKFMLFMRRTNRVQYKDKGRDYSIKKILNSDGSLTLLNSVVDGCPKQTFHIETSESIPVNDEAFASAGVPIAKTTRINGAGIEESVIMHINERGEYLSEVKDIPDRLASAESVEISFAVMVDDNGAINPITGSSDNNSDSCFYSYLPMNEHRFRLAMYVNADFDLHSDREGVKADSPWNEFLFFHLGRQLVKAVANIASPKQKEYLCLLQANPFDETNSETAKLSKAFNRGYKESLAQEPFVIEDLGNKVLAKDIILDESGLSSSVSRDLFYILFDDGKRLPSPNINSSILRHDVFGVQAIDVAIVVQIMERRRYDLNQWIKTASHDERKRLLQWLYDNHATTAFVKQLPVVEVRGELITISDLFATGKCVILSSTVALAGSILDKLGLEVVVIHDEDDVLWNYIDQTSQQAFEIIAGCLKDRAVDKCNGRETEHLSVDEKIQLVAYLKNLDKIGDKSIASINLFDNAKGIPTPLSEMMSFRESYPAFLGDYIISEVDNNEDVQKYLVAPSNEFDMIVWPRRKALGISVKELFDCCISPIEPYLNKMIEESNKNSELEPLTEFVTKASLSIKKFFLERMTDVRLDPEAHYNKDAFASQVIAIVTGIWDDLTEHERLSISNKFLYGNRRITEFSVKDDVVCSYNIQGVTKTVVFSLAKLLPSYANISDGINKVKSLFDIPIPDTFFSAKEKPLRNIANEIKSLLNLSCGTWNPGAGTAEQYLFEVYFYRAIEKYSSNWVFFINLADQADDFVSDLMDCMYDNKISLASSPFAYRFHDQICNKYFANEYTLDGEQIPNGVERWANSKEKRQYLIDNGVKTGDSKLIRLRKAFSLNENIDFEKEEITEHMAKAILSFAVQDNPTHYVEDNQRDFVVSIHKKYPRCLTSDTDFDKLDRYAVEWDAKKYQEWKAMNNMSILLYPGLMPRILRYDNVVMAHFEDGEYLQANARHSIYLSQEQRIDDLLFKLVGNKDAAFNMSDYDKLCRKGKVSISEDELKSRDDKIASQAIYIAELEARLGIRNADIGRSKSDMSKKDQYAAQIEAQQLLMSQRPDWEYPEGYGKVNESGAPMFFSIATVTDRNGESMVIVLKSYQKTDERFHINPEEWDAIVRKDGKLLVYTPRQGRLEIVEISKDELIKKQPRIQISFNTSNLDDSQYSGKISDLASILRHFEHLTFDFDQFRVSKDAVAVKDIYLKHNTSISSATEADI